MRLDRIDQALENCENHLSSTGSRGSEIEQLLTFALLTIISAELEQRIKATVLEKCASIDDGDLRDFVESTIGAVIRSIKSSELAGVLGRFGTAYRTDFNRKTQETAKAETFYNNLITNRNDISHSSGSNASFEDVKSFYEEGHVILDFFRDTLLAIGPRN